MLTISLSCDIVTSLKQATERNKMKSRIQKKEASKGRPITEYPCYGIIKSGEEVGLIVYFKASSNGTVFFSGESEYDIGYNVETWVMRHFTVFEDELVVSN